MFFSDCGCLVCYTPCSSLPLFRRTCWYILEKISRPPHTPPERCKYSIRLNGVVIQETIILDLYFCDSLNCHIGNWWCLQVADWDVGLVHPMGIATVGIPSIGRFSTCRTVNITALHIHIISPQSQSARSRNKWVSTVFCSTVLQRRNYKSVQGVVWYRNTDNLMDFKGKVLNPLQVFSKSRPVWDDKH